MQEPELPAWSRERTAGRHDGNHSSLMWCLWLERLVCPHLGGQGGLPTHPRPDSAPSSFEAAVPPRPELLTPCLLALLSSAPCPPSFANAATKAQSRRTHGSPCKRASLVLRLTSPSSSVSLVTPFHFAGAALHHLFSMKKTTVWQCIPRQRGSLTLAADTCLTPLPTAFLDQPPCSRAMSILS